MGHKFKAGEPVIIRFGGNILRVGKIVMVLKTYPGQPEYSYRIEYYYPVDIEKEYYERQESEFPEGRLLPYNEITKMLYLND